MTAVAGAVGAGTPLAAAAAGSALWTEPMDGKYDFETPYNRFGTDSTKYDSPNRTYGKDSVQVGMGIADMDFRAAPSITKALMERMQHENWGYLDMGGPAVKGFTDSIVAWNKKRYGPTGNCWSPEDLMRLGEICLRRRVVVLADEIHCDFVNKGAKYTPFASLPNKAVVNNSITFKAASKSFGLAAMKCAWFFSDNMDYLNRVKVNNRADLTTMGMIASKAAYAGGEDWLNQCVENIDGNQAFVE